MGHWHIPLNWTSYDLNERVSVGWIPCVKIKRLESTLERLLCSVVVNFTTQQVLWSTEGESLNLVGRGKLSCISYDTIIWQGYLKWVLLLSQ